MSSRARLFVAIPVRPAVRREIARETRALRDAEAVRAVPAEQLHLTLRFLGAVDRARIGPLGDRLHEACASLTSFDLRLESAGAFPNPRRARVLWVGVAATPKLRAARAAVEDAIAAAGFERETRAFRPHVTIGRVRRGRTPPAGLAELLERVEISGASPVEAITLFESVLGPGGARHDALVSCAPGASRGPSSTGSESM